MQRRRSRPVPAACTIRVVDVVDFSHVFYLPMPLAVCSAEIAHGFQHQKSPLVVTLVMHRESIPAPRCLHIGSVARRKRWGSRNSTDQIADPQTQLIDELC